MKNWRAPGDSLELTAPAGGVVAGTCYKIGDLVVLATVTVAASAKANFVVTGVIQYAKVSAQAWTELQKIYWDNTAFNFTNVVGTNTLVGVAAAAAANPSSVGLIRLDGVAR